MRRIVRDRLYRGYGASKTLALWPSVRRGEHRNIFPFQESADDIFNADSDHAKGVLKGVLAAGEVPRSWHAYLTPKGIDEELLELVLATTGWSFSS